MSDDLTKTHVRKVLATRAEWQAAFIAKVREIEANGQRIVDAGQAGSYGDDGLAPWEVIDWRTGNVLATGRGDFEGFSSELDRLNADGRWVFLGKLTAEDDLAEYPETPGLPASLAEALEEWVEAKADPEDVAAWIGEPVDYVARCMREESDAARAA